MIKSVIILTLAFIAAGCNNAQPVQNTSANAAESAPQRAEKLQTTTTHTTENQPQKMPDSNGVPGGNSKWSQGGEAIDTTKFDADIKEADSALDIAMRSVRIRSKPPSEAERQATEGQSLKLAEAYFDRGFALTEARQYAAALGDYRRALKYDPNHEESKKWIDQIISIYGMLKKDYPKEGEEPPPLKMKK